MAADLSSSLWINGIGVFSQISDTQGRRAIMATNPIGGQSAGFTFDNSLVVPTANEFRTASISVAVYMSY